MSARSKSESPRRTRSSWTVRGLNGGCSGTITQKDGEFETSYYCPGYGQTRGTYKLTLVDDGTLEVRQPDGSLYGAYRRSGSEE